MKLASPFFLLALGLVIPIVITFLVRKRHQVVRVPSTMVWRLGARSIAKNRRIRNLRRLLALLACVAGVAAWVVAAARPTGTRHDATIYVVDVSASMAPSISEARRWLTRDVANRGLDARVAIVLAGSQPVVALPPSAPGPGVDEALAALRAESGVAAIDEALLLADGLAAGTHARIVVVSDHAIDATASRLHAEQHVIERKGENIGIASMFTRPAPDARDDEEREASVTIATSSNMARRARLHVTLGGRTVADRAVAVPAQGDVVERVLLRGAGRLVARVRPDDGESDLLGSDDEAALDEMARRPPRVALLAKKGPAEFFVAKALRAAGVSELIEVDPDGDAPSNPEIAVVLSDGPARPENVPTFFIGTEPTSIGLGASAAAKEKLHLRSMAADEPLLRGVVLDELTTVRARVATHLPRGAKSMIDFDGGPALVTGGAGTHAWVWLGIDPEGSDLVLRVAFPVLVSNVIAQLGGAAQVVTAKTVPRSEVILESRAAAATMPTTSEPRWRVPLSLPVVIALLGALLLSLEAWFSVKRRFA